MKQTVKFKKLTPNAIVPTYGTEFSAGADLYSGMTEPVIINAGTTEFIKTGIAIRTKRYGVQKRSCPSQ